MAHWYKNEITADAIRTAFPILNDKEKFGITATFKDLGWHGCCCFEVTIVQILLNGYNRQLTIRLSEQPGCCGYGNVFLPSSNLKNIKDDNFKNDMELWEAIACWMGRTLCLAGLQFVGTGSQSCVKAMLNGGWKQVHSIVNPRYSVTGSTLAVICKNLNAYRRKKPLFARTPGDRFYG